MHTAGCLSFWILILKNTILTLNEFREYVDTVIKHPEIRNGQKAFNCLWKIRPEYIMLKLAKAIIFAKIAHDGQLRKEGTPYIEHPMRVMFKVATYTMDEDLLCAAVLHDIIEDTKYDFTDINMRFGERVANLVMELTNVEDKKESRAKRIAARNDKYFNMSEDAKVIKMCDRMDNLSTLSSLDPKFAKMYLQESKDMVQYMRSSSDSDVLYDLESKIYLEERMLG